VWTQVASLFLAKPGDPKAIARRLGVVIALLGLAWTLLLAGIGVAIWGGIALLSTWLPTMAAVLITGAVAVAIALLILFARRRKRIVEHNPAEAIVERFPMESVVLAAAAGFMIAHFPEVRTLIFRQLVAR
jgi:hypothetical protein